MATITKGYTFGATELVTNTKLHTLVDSGTVTAIVNADVDTNAGIVATKLATIATTGKVSGAALTLLPNIPSDAGEIPQANIPKSKILGTPTTLTIADGAITVTDSYHMIETEGASATDDLTTINGSAIGRLLVLRSVNSGRDVTLKDGSPLRLAGDFILSDTDDTITLICISENVFSEISRSDNA